MYSHSTTHSSKIIALAAIIISVMPLCALTERMPEKSARTPNTLLTAATPTGRPKYQLICAFAARQSVSCSAPRRTSVR